MTDKLSKSEQSRINGAKSKGPTSIEGKSRSSQNAIKHGFASVINVVLRIEDRPAFDRHLEGFRASFKPADYAEQIFVDQLAAINWRQSRLVALETALIDAQIDVQHDRVCEINPDCAGDPYFHLVQAWQALARQPQPPHEDRQNDPALPPDRYDINSLELLRRYQTSLDRQFRNTLLNLRQYRKDFAASPTSTPTAEVPEPNEPTESPAGAAQPNEIRSPIRPLTLLKPSTSRPLPPPPGEIRQ